MSRQERRAYAKAHGLDWQHRPEPHAPGLPRWRWRLLD